MQPDQSLKSLKRGLRTLILLTQHRTMTTAEVARRLALPRTTAERILATLKEERFIERDAATKRYALARRIQTLAGAFSAEDRLVAAARPLLFEKTREIGWPLAIAVADGDRMSVRLTTDPATSLGLHKRHVGSELAMAACSGGIAHLAFLDEAEREAQIGLLASSDDPAQALARDRAQLDAHLAAARRRGFALSPDLGRERALSVPLFEDGRVKAVLVMMYIARGMPQDRLIGSFVPQMRSLAAAIQLEASGEVGASQEPDPV